MKEDKEKIVKKRKTNKVKKAIKKAFKVDEEEKEPTIKKDRNIKLNRSKDKVASFSIVEVIVIILITGLIVSVCSGVIVYNNYGRLASINNSEGEGEVGEIIDSFNHILNSYVEDVDKQELIDAAIKGMYNYLNDGYSVYVDEETTTSLTERLEGEYEGVGIEITMNEENQIYITRIFESTPAEKAGLKVGDIIISLDNEDLEGKTTSDLANGIKKSNKTEFIIGYVRDGIESTVTLKREKVVINSVTTKTYDAVGYIKLETFSATTADQVEKCINNFDNNITSLIIDVRNNTGGYLSAAYDTADLLLNKNQIVYQLKKKDDSIQKKYATGNAIRTFDKVVVLVNEISASASEILAAALSENLNATLVGVTTFGKGTVQETSSLSSGAMVKYTTAYWLTPKGNSINETGLIPEIGLTDKAETEEDEQLLKAIEVAKEK